MAISMLMGLAKDVWTVLSNATNFTISQAGINYYSSSDSQMWAPHAVNMGTGDTLTVTWVLYADGGGSSIGAGTGVSSGPLTNITNAITGVVQQAQLLQFDALTLLLGALCSLGLYVLFVRPFLKYINREVLTSRARNEKRMESMQENMAFTGGIPQQVNAEETKNKFKNNKDDSSSTDGHYSYGN